ncbi:MAG TPA: hypothetical protein PKD19_00140 [Candidatus Saccharibacteria bacterium]|jgi:hypothetical protein|nr:hypothetical protein [Candidatus Saccharibacteria bacterium]HMR38179.1 hypothetical protein [Candidatus Saccharibacteria bacterium]
MNKKILIAIIIITLLVVLVLLFAKQNNSNTNNIVETSQDHSALYKAANIALRSQPNNTIPYDRPMQLEDDVKKYGENWLTATITLLDENPESHKRTMVYVFQINSDLLKVIDFQPKGWFIEKNLPQEAPSEMIRDITWDPDSDY